MKLAAKQRRRCRQPRAKQPDGSLPLALRLFDDALRELCEPRWCEEQPVEPRYKQLADALTAQRVSSRHAQPSSMIPLWVDALKLKLEIDQRTHQLTHPYTDSSDYFAGVTPYPVVNLWRKARAHPWRPQDSTSIQYLAHEIRGWSTAIDDLFTSKPIYLPDACPHCQRDHARKLSDTGEMITTRALVVTVDRAVCQNCHDVWEFPDKLKFFSLLLGYHRGEILAS